MSSQQDRAQGVHRRSTSRGQSRSRLGGLVAALAVAALIALVAAVNTGTGAALRYIAISAAVVVGIWALVKINGEVTRHH